LKDVTFEQFFALVIINHLFVLTSLICVFARFDRMKRIECIEAKKGARKGEPVNHKSVFSKLLFLTLFLVLAPSALARVTWYVDGVKGNDNDNCKTPQTACKTIGHAISLASPGDVILVGAATYNENLTINFDLAIHSYRATTTSTTIIEGQNMNTVVAIPNSNTHVVLSGLTIRNGGEGVSNAGTTTISNTVIADNVFISDFGANGGGIYNTGTLTLERTTVSNNEIGSPQGYGGGIYNDGTLTINDSAITGNSSGCMDTYGIGIYNDRTLVVNRSTISGNSSSRSVVSYGGAIDNDHGTATVNNSTLYGNSVSGSFIGGGIYNTGAMTINNSTVSSNSTKYGGIVNSDGTIILQNTIVADNGENCSGTMTSNGYNLSSDNTCNFKGSGDLNNTEPNLGPLQNNGGPTQTLAEFLGSPTIDAGNPEGCTDGQGQLLKTDQRGFPRPDKEDPSGCDMGAFERQSD
jgi:hypothetical protein